MSVRYVATKTSAISGEIPIADLKLTFFKNYYYFLFVFYDIFHSNSK